MPQPRQREPKPSVFGALAFYAGLGITFIATPLVTLYELVVSRNYLVGVLLALYQVIDFRKITTYRGGCEKRVAKMLAGCATLFAGLAIAPSRGVWVVAVAELTTFYGFFLLKRHNPRKNFSLLGFGWIESKADVHVPE